MIIKLGTATDEVLTVDNFYTFNYTAIPDNPGPSIPTDLTTNPLTITAIEDNCTVILSGTTSMLFRTNKNADWSKGNTNFEINLNANEYVQFLRAEPLQEGIAGKFSINGGSAEATGNIHSLLGKTELHESCFDSLFSGSYALVKAPELPATNLAPYCYHSMFKQCQNLAAAPELPATTLAEHCYDDMFSYDTFNTPPELPATNLAPYCYYSMFYRCFSLNKAPELPATNLAEKCYSFMFKYTNIPEIVLPATELANGCYEDMVSNCDKLQKIDVSFTKWPAFTTWRQENLPSAGVFYKPSELPEQFGISYIPNDWTVVNK